LALWQEFEGSVQSGIADVPPECASPPPRLEITDPPAPSFLFPPRPDEVPEPVVLDPAPFELVPLDPLPFALAALDPVPLDPLPFALAALDPVPLDPLPFALAALDPVPLEALPELAPLPFGVPCEEPSPTVSGELAFAPEVSDPATPWIESTCTSERPLQPIHMRGSRYVKLLT
jgi:hypothetical protein